MKVNGFENSSSLLQIDVHSSAKRIASADQSVAEYVKPSKGGLENHSGKIGNLEEAISVLGNLSNVVKTKVANIEDIHKGFDLERVMALIAD